MFPLQIETTHTAKKKSLKKVLLQEKCQFFVLQKKILLRKFFSIKKIFFQENMSKCIMTYTQFFVLIYDNVRKKNL